MIINFTVAFLKGSTALNAVESFLYIHESIKPKHTYKFQTINLYYFILIKRHPCATKFHTTKALTK